MKKRIVIKMSLLLCVALTIFAMVSCGLLIHNDNQLIGDNLKSLANGYAGALIVSNDPQDVVKYDTNENVRVTIIDKDGVVLADSYGGESTMDNHLQREEIQNANTADNTRIVKRKSDTANNIQLYFAKKVSIGDSYQYLRVSVESASVGTYIPPTVITVIILVIIMVGLSTLMVSSFTDKSMRPLAELASSIEGITSGNYTPVAPTQDDDKLNVLISKINDVSELIIKGIQATNSERDKLSNLLENMSQGVIASDADGKIVICNPRAREIFGYNDTISKSLTGVMCEPTIMDALKQVNKGEQRVVNFDKGKRNYISRITKVDSTTSNLDIITLITDVTSIRLAERERREFFANASHELKTPLTAIKGYADLISTGIATGDKARGYGENIVSEGARLLDMINDMLILSRLDENIDVGTRVEVSLTEVADKIIIGQQETIKSLNLKTKLEGAGSAVISLENIQAILSNIITNAIKYNKPNGEIAIDITTNKKNTIMSIKDSGIGIDTADLPRVTERFFKADTSHAKNGSTGLGLAIVKHICTLNNIQLDIKSTLGQGTTVTLTFKNVKK